MKTARKLTSLLLALLLVFALAATAAADDTSTPIKGTITVDNPRENLTYTAYKIFDVVYDTAREHYSYTIKNNSPWYPTVSGYAKEENGMTLAEVANTTPTTYVVTIDDPNGTNKFSAPSFADALKKALADDKVTDNGSTLTPNGTSVSVNDLDLGYYFVKSDDNNALCNLTTTDNIVTIHDKNDVPFEKTAPERDVEVGKKVNYTITGKVPDSTGYETYTYEITDTMSTGLTFNEDTLKVMVGNTNVTNDNTKCTILKGTEAAPNTFKVTIFVKKCNVGDKIVVTYNATVNENAVATVSTNKAVLTYSNKPGTNGTGTIEKEHEVYSAQIEINKFWKEGGTNKSLAGVGFKLYKEETTGTDTVKKYYQWDETNKEVKWVDDTQATPATEVVTTADGKAYFKGLANGTYHLVETTTPAGYNPLTGPVDVTVTGSADNPTSLTVKQDVENKTGAVLPSTGGMGTTVFYVLGAVLVLGAGVLLVTKKRMSRSEG